MSHFADEEWADFARNEVESDQQTKMQRHLDDGCKRCTRTLRVWREVSRIGGAEGSYEPPASVVRQVRGLYGIHKRTVAGRVAQAARLLFDSALAPLPAGVRSAAVPSSRQVVFGNQKRVVKLQIEKAVDDRVALLGQIVDQKDPLRGLENQPVLVREGRGTVERTLTNSLGEFELTLELTPRVRLQVGDGGDCLVFDLGAQCAPRHAGEGGSQRKIKGFSPARG